MAKVDENHVSAIDQNKEREAEQEEIHPRLTISREILADIDELCELLGIDREEFIVESMVEHLIFYHESPEALSEKILESTKVSTLFERIRGNLNRRLGKSYLKQRYFEKGKVPSSE